MKTKITACFIIFLLSISISNAQVTERSRPAGWDNLVFGGRIMDRFLFMPDLGGMTSDTWGAQCVIPRDINNGIEEKEWSYWGGNSRLMDDGKYHLFVCRWPENSRKGHMEWPRSVVVHAVAENSYGSYKVVAEIGKGHNPEWYITDSGKYVIYVIGGYYVSDDINGIWEYKKFEFDKRDRKIIEGLSNLSFAKREDGSFIMVCRGGGIWISKDGLSTWHQVTDERVYPPVDGRFEDPLIWKTDIQYHLIVNDWLGRIAWHLRSKDGVHWKTDVGEAYLPGIAKYKDGTVEDWFKFERIKVLQDKFGRAVQANFAVIDTLKRYDKPNDNHSSKNIAIPLLPGKLLSVVNKKPITEKTKTIKILIKAEPGFDPYNDIDFETLMYGAPEVVDFGKGCKVKSVERNGDDVVVTFYGENNGFTKESFAGKLLGRDKNRDLVFGYSRLPGVEYVEPLLSARKPKVVNSGKGLRIDIENFGQVSSEKTTLQVYKISGNETVEIAKTTIPAFEPYQSKTIELDTNVRLSKKDGDELVIYFNKGEKDEVINKFEGEK